MPGLWKVLARYPWAGPAVWVSFLALGVGLLGLLAGRETDRARRTAQLGPVNNEKALQDVGRLGILVRGRRVLVGPRCRLLGILSGGRLRFHELPPPNQDETEWNWRLRHPPGELMERRPRVSQFLRCDRPLQREMDCRRRPVGERGEILVPVVGAMLTGDNPPDGPGKADSAAAVRSALGDKIGRAHV